MGLKLGGDNCVKALAPVPVIYKYWWNETSEAMSSLKKTTPFLIKNVLDLKDDDEEVDGEEENSQTSQAVSDTGDNNSVISTSSEEDHSSQSRKKRSGDDPPCDGDQPSSRRRRTSYTNSQIGTLEGYFKFYPYPDAFLRDTISKTIGISPSKVQVWFQNRRARYRKREKPHQPLQRPLFPILTPPPCFPPAICPYYLPSTSSSAPPSPSYIPSVPSSNDDS